MTIHLPNELENGVQAAVQSGQFASVDDAMAEAVRLLLRELSQRQPRATPPVNAGNPPPDPILGLMHDHTELMDEIVADAYRQRREETWRDFDL
jgi:Arc/MetJ-type ribon-helix-helix transcriptional regulator